MKFITLILIKLYLKNWFTHGRDHTTARRIVNLFKAHYTSHNNHLHHNLSFNQQWNSIVFNLGNAPDQGGFEGCIINNNTSFHDEYLEGNDGVSGGMRIRLGEEDGKVINIKNVTFANNLILNPRDFALLIEGTGDPDKLNIVFAHNLTDKETESDRMSSERNQSRGYRLVRKPEQLDVYPNPIVNAPEQRDFRLRAGTPAEQGGFLLGSDFKPTQKGGGYIGAFGPGANWVELAR